jgi:hypothetical protein
MVLFVVGLAVVASLHSQELEYETWIDSGNSRKDEKPLPEIKTNQHPSRIELAKDE